MTSPRWLSPDERTTWVRFAAVLGLLPATLDSQLSQDAGLTHFEYFALAMLSEAPGHVLRSSELAARTNASLPRLSRVIDRLESRGLVNRYPCPEDRRATNVALTHDGHKKVVASAPGHVAHVREMVIDALTPEQMQQLSEISAALLARLDPSGKMVASILEND